MAHKPQKPSVTAQFAWATQEERVAVAPKARELYIGIPREQAFQENRVPLTPESVALLVNRGHRIVIESKAGSGANFSDSDYSEVGAEIAFDAEKVYKADIVLRVTPPSIEEIGMMQVNQTLLSPIHLPTLEAATLDAFMRKKITALAFEYLKDGGIYPIVRALSEMAGISSVQIAAQYLSSFSEDSKGMILGGITGVPPSKVVILGAGVVGEFATRAAIGLGAEVKVFDNNLHKLTRLQNNIGQRIFTSVIEPTILSKHLETTDVAIGAIHSELGRTPVVVSEAMISKMQPGSVVVDVSIDQGGCFETSEMTTHKNPTFTKYDVIHYCVPNIAARVPRSSSRAVSNVLASILLRISDFNSLDKLLWEHKGIRKSAYLYKGKLTNMHLSDQFGIKYTNLDLLLTSSI